MEKFNDIKAGLVADLLLAGVQVTPEVVAYIHQAMKETYSLCLQDPHLKIA